MRHVQEQGKVRLVRNIVANRYVKTGRKPVIHCGAWYVPEIQLHVLLIVASQIHEMDTKFEFVIFENFSATSDPIF